MAIGVLCAACAGSVKPDTHTGADGKRRGAKPIKLQVDPESKRGEATARGVVTYPGGDRVDWRMIDLDGKSGDLDLELRWKSPRPGLDLSFKVFDDEGNELEPAVPPKKRSRLGKKAAKLIGVGGRIFVKIYASDRGDAGDYRLRVAFLDRSPVIWGECDRAAPDNLNPNCDAVIKELLAEQERKARAEADRIAEEQRRIEEERAEAARRAAELAEKERLSRKEAEEKAKMCPDPNRPDPTDERCYPYLDPCDLEAIDPKNPRCFEAGIEWPTTVKHVATSDNRTEIHINLGAKDGVKANWTGYLVDDLGLRIDKGDFVITRVYDKHSVAKLDAKVAVVKRSGKKVFVIPMVKKEKEGP